MMPDGCASSRNCCRGRVGKGAATLSTFRLGGLPPEIGEPREIAEQSRLGTINELGPLEVLPAVSESEQDRIQRETDETEKAGAGWVARSDLFLVGYVSQQRGGQFHTPAIVEMHRRELEATRDLTRVQRTLLETIERFNTDSERYSRRIELLTWAMFALAVAQLVAAIVQISKS